MPIYRLGCPSCGEEREVMLGINKDNPLCPDCGGEMHKLPTFPAKIDVKGTYRQGYKDDYAKDYRRRLQEAKS